MIKRAMLFSKKPGLSSQDFKTYYETRHTKLALELIPRIAGYRRNYVLPGSVTGAHIAKAPPPPAFDVITESWIKDRSDGELLVKDFANPKIADAITKDEENFFNRSNMIAFGVDEYESPKKTLGSAEGAPDDGSMLKMVVMMRRKPGMSREAFIDYYENHHAPLASHLPQIAGYKRNYVIPGAAPKRIPEIADRPNIDVMSHFWFRTPADFDAFRAQLGDPKLARMMAEDEAKVFDRTSFQMFMVEECVTPPADLAAAAARKGYANPVV